MLTDKPLFALKHQKCSKGGESCTLTPALLLGAGHDATGAVALKATAAPETHLHLSSHVFDLF